MVWARHAHTNFFQRVNFAHWFLSAQNEHLILVVVAATTTTLRHVSIMLLKIKGSKWTFDFWVVSKRAKCQNDPLTLLRVSAPRTKTENVAWTKTIHTTPRPINGSKWPVDFAYTYFKFSGPIWTIDFQVVTLTTWNIRFLDVHIKSFISLKVIIGNDISLYLDSNNLFVTI